MKPTSDLEGLPGKRANFAEHQDEYETLPAMFDKDGVVASRWTLTLEERLAIMDGANIELFVWTFGRPLQPVALRVQGAEEAP